MDALRSAHVLADLFWTSNPTVQSAIGLMALIALFILAAVHGTLWFRLLEAGRVEHALAEICSNTAGSRSDAERQRRLNGINNAFAGSFLEGTWQEFRRRREEVLAAAPEDRAPLRMAHLFDERPLLPHGVRRSLLPALPVVFFAIGVVGFIGSLVLASGGTFVTDTARTAHLLQSLGAGLQLALWGTLFSLVSLVGARILDGRSERLAATIDALIASSYGVLSHAEFATRAAQAQRLGFDRLGLALATVSRDMREAIEQGMKQIEESTAAAASLVTEDQRKSIRVVIEELSQTLREGVEHNLESLQTALQDTVENQGQVSGGLVSAFEQMEHGAEAHSRASNSLEEAAQIVERAALGMGELIEQIQPTLAKLDALAPRHQTSQPAAGGPASAPGPRNDAVGGIPGDPVNVLSADPSPLRAEVAPVPPVVAPAPPVTAAQAAHPPQVTASPIPPRPTVEPAAPRMPAVAVSAPPARAAAEPVPAVPTVAPAAGPTQLRDEPLEEDDAAAIRRLSEALRGGLGEFSDAVAREAGASRAAYAPLKPETSSFANPGASDEADLATAGRGYSALLSRYRRVEHAEPASLGPGPDERVQSTALATPLLTADRERRAAEAKAKAKAEMADPAAKAAATARTNEHRAAEAPPEQASPSPSPERPEPSPDEETERRKRRLERFFGA